jgi:hypothetical protein
MSTLSIISGLLLVLVGVAGYVYGLSTGAASPTALIPAAFGVVIAGLGAIAGAKEKLRMHVMHVAVLIALIGFLIPAIRLVLKREDLVLSAAVLSQAAMAAICLLFVIFAVRSFIEARRGD